MRNEEIARIFLEIAQLLELKGDNPFRIRAYVRAAELIAGLSEELKDILREKRLQELPGIGKDLASKIEELIQTNQLTYYTELRKKIPKGLLAMLAIPGLGPKTVKHIYDSLKINTVDALKKAAENGALLVLPGVQKKTQNNILKGIALLEEGRERTPYPDAQRIVRLFIDTLTRLSCVKKIEYAGSLRRKKETVKDIDILVASRNQKQVMDTFVTTTAVRQIIAQGDTKSTVLAGERNIQVDLRVVTNESFGAALLYFTGSKQFNIALRQRAMHQGLKVNEYGLYKGKKRIASKTEKEMFSGLGLTYVPAELREDRGEIEAAQKNVLPRLVEQKNIKGDFHVHSHYSDGNASLKEIVEKAQQYHYGYIAVADHSQSLHIAHGLKKKDVYRKMEEIRSLNKKLKSFCILAATEVDILSDGTLDYDDALLREFDVVVASIHSGFKQTKQQLTKRIVSACRNKYVHIIGHPTGRLIGARGAYEIEFDEVMQAAKDNNVALEINCFPQRLDLNDIHAHRARGRGVKLALGTDAHSLEHLAFMEFGVSIARRSWCEKEDVLNCMELERLKKWLKK